MPRITPARAQARRRQIVDAALICFARRGFHKTTMRDIVKQSALSPGAIYCHFTSKHDIIIAVVEERHRRETELLRQASQSKNLAFAIDALVADFVAVLRNPEERAWRRLTVQLWAESLHDRRLAVAVTEGVDAPRAILTDMVRQAKARGELPKSLGDDAAARMLIACFQGLVLQQVWDPKIDATACAGALAMLVVGQSGAKDTRSDGMRPSSRSQEK
jgi:AcrR family transcriptional regulator